MHLRLTFAGLAVLVVLHSNAAPASAGADIAESKHERCEAAGSMMDMTVCMHRELEESDARLDIVYGTLITALAKPDGLVRAQRAWHAYRDAQCTFENEGLAGGTARPFSTDLCRTRLAEQRIAELEQIGPCNGCVEFKPQYHEPGKGFSLPLRAH